MRAFCALSLVWGIVFLGNVSSAAPPEANLRSLVLQAPPATAVNSVAVSPDGSIVATAGGEGGVRLYNAHSGQMLRTIGEAGDRCVVFAADGRTLAAAGFHMDKLNGVFDVQSGKRLLTLPGHTEWEVDSLALSPDGKLLASTGTDKQILVWELETGKLRLQLKDQPFRSAALAFSPDSATLATAGGDKLVRLWDVAKGELRQSLTGHRDWVAALAFSPDGQTIASASCDWGFHRGHDWVRPLAITPEQSEWKLWNVTSGKLERTEAESGRMLALAFAPSGKSLACTVAKDVRLYDLATDAPGRVIASHNATATSVAFTPDGGALLSGSHDQTVKRTDLTTGKVQWQTPGYFEQVNAVALSSDGLLLVTGSSDHRFARGSLQAGVKHIGPGAVRLWDAKSGRMLRRLGDPNEQVMAVAISSDGRRIAAGGGIEGGKGVVHMWDAKIGEEVWSSKDFTNEVLSLAFEPEGSSLAAAGSDGLVKIVDLKSGQISRTLPDHKGGATSLAFSGDGSVLVCGQGHGGAKTWDAQSGRLLHSSPVVTSLAATSITDRRLTSIGLGRDGTTLATCLASNVNAEFVDPVKIWNARTGELVRDFAAEKVHGRPMALSPDGTIVATGGKSVKLWDVRTGKMVRELMGHLKRTQAITFSADGKLLVAGGSYGTTNVWEVETGKHLVVLFAFSAGASGAPEDDWLACHPDGSYHGSPGAGRYLAWRVGDELVTPDSLKVKLDRPDRIESALKLAP